MEGLLFTLGLLAVMVGATYLIQAALWLFALALFAALAAVQAVAGVAGAAARSVWPLDPEAAVALHRPVNAAA